MGRQVITSTSASATISLAEKIGWQLRGGEAIKLIGDLGGGKTTFVRGLTSGMGSRDAVRSPSFTLANEYRAQDLMLHHFDFYRLAEAGVMRGGLAEALADPKAIVAVDWGDLTEDVLPEERLTVSLRPTGPDIREIVLEYPEQLEYLMKNT
jgi:tRNA threonylcarbamoyladenosine biosynthesis protein TsaE